MIVPIVTVIPSPLGVVLDVVQERRGIPQLPSWAGYLAPSTTERRPQDPGGGGRQAVGPRLDRHDGRHLRAPHLRGRPPGDGRGRLPPRSRGATVTAAVTAVRAERSLLHRLMAAVRPEFRPAVVVPPMDDPIMGVPACRVTGCGRPSSTRQLCPGHYARWREIGPPDLERFCEQTPPGAVGREKPRPCRVDGCRYGRSEAGLCATHATRWRFAGKPAIDEWLQAPGHRGPHREPKACAVSQCALWATPRGVGLCRGHTDRWERAGRPDVDRYAATASARERTQGLEAPKACICEGCEFGRKGQGLCGRHHQRWLTAGRPPIGPLGSDAAGRADRRAAAVHRAPVHAVGHSGWCRSAAVPLPPRPVGTPQPSRC